MLPLIPVTVPLSSTTTTCSASFFPLLSVTYTFETGLGAIDFQKVVAFDVFEGDNIPKDKKSVAINVTLQALDKTLSEKDLDQVSQKIIEKVKQKTGATIRS